MTRDARLAHVCPSYCHRCPELRDMVMPMCYGSVTGYGDEYDLSACTCDSSDPIVTRLRLVQFQDAWIRQLRDLRRYRAVNKNMLKRILEITAMMQFSGDRVGLQRAMRDVHGLATQLRVDLHRNQPVQSAAVGQ